MKSSLPIIALIGNPNAGKSSLFNQLTGLRQKTGNFPGVTVDKKMGICSLDALTEVQVLDLPGTYSLYPKSLDEQIASDILLNPQSTNYPSVAVVVADASNLKRNLLLFTEISDIGIPCILVLNMLDVAERMQLDINGDLLSNSLGVPVIYVNARRGEGIENLKFAILGELKNTFSIRSKPLLIIPNQHLTMLAEAKEVLNSTNDYRTILILCQATDLRFLSAYTKQKLQRIIEKYHFNRQSFQASETVSRYMSIGQIADASVKDLKKADFNSFSARIDKFVLHKFWGYLIFFIILFLIFNTLFSWAEYPMNAIDSGIAMLSDWLKCTFPASKIVDLLTDGLLAGIGGVVMFLPQITFLFLFISLLEESGYMSRVMVLMDKLMQRFGLNGKSIVPLMSGVACAVPAIMATRSISNWKDRLISIMVTPLMSCSARLPVYTILIALVVPNKRLLGIVNIQGLALMGLYLLGFVAALGSAWVMKKILKTREPSYFIMELPTYKPPRFSHISLSLINNLRAFIENAGKIIVAISVVLWVLSSYGPANAIEKAEATIRANTTKYSAQEISNKVAASRLENSYAGHFGKFIEPAIKPLGYDWKIGVALITSFAAREVFVGTMSTIYSLGTDVSDQKHNTIRQRMAAEINPTTGKPLYSTALALSLCVFYAFAMQCMSTLATTYRETKKWKYPAIQFLYMTVLAYLSAFVVFQIFS